MTPYTRLWILAGLGLGCSDAAILFLPYPDTAGHQSMVLVVESSMTRRLVGIDLSHGSFPVRLSDALTDGEPWTAHALLFTEGLEALGVQPGRLTENPSDKPFPIRLEPERVLARSGDSAAEDPWVPITTQPIPFDPLLIENLDPYGFCPRVELSQAELSGARNEVIIALSLGSDRAFLATGLSGADISPFEDQSLFLAERKGERIEVQRLERPGDLRLHAGAVDSGGRVLVAGSDGFLSELHIDGLRVTTSTITALPGHVGTIDWLEVGTNMIVAMNRTGEVHGATRSSDQSYDWEAEPLYQFSPNLGRNARTGELMLRSDREAWVVRASERTVVKVRHSGTAFLPLEVDRGLEDASAIGLSALVELDGFGVLAGLTDGEVRRYDEASHTWGSMGPTRFTQVVHDLVPTGRGFLMVGGTGLFNFYVDPEGYCPLEAAGYMGLRASGTVKQALRMGDGVLFGGSSLGNSTQAVTWVRPRW